MRLLISAIIFLLFSSTAWATTWYVRNDGGTSTVCTGTTDAADIWGSGSGHPCAFSHPAWALGSVGSSRLISGGDTLIIDDINYGAATSSGRAEYKIGYGMPNSSCSLAEPYGCTLDQIPSGPDINHPTKILGKKWNTGCSAMPQFYGTEQIYAIFDLSNVNNFEIQCLEITDHVECGFRYGSTHCPEVPLALNGDYGKIGIQTQDSSNGLLKNVDIHGMASRAFLGGRMTDYTFSHVKMVGQISAGWDGDIVGSDSNSGTMRLSYLTIRYAGCLEHYPRSGTGYTEGDYYDCCSQNEGCYADGFGTGAITSNWIIDHADISHNVDDGLDMLYQTGGTVRITDSIFEGNGGNQVKIGTDAVIENSKIIGNCTYFTDAGIAMDAGATFLDCRSGGDTVALDFITGMQVSIINTTIAGSVGNYVMYAQNNNAGTNPCNGTEKLTLRNVIVDPGTAGQWQGLGQKVAYYAAASCPGLTLDQDYIVANSSNLSASYCPSITHKSCSDPLFTGPLSGDNYNVTLGASSPAIDLADETVSCQGVCSVDINGYDRGASWDTGTYERSTVASCSPNGVFCGQNSDCCTNNCNGNYICSVPGSYLYNITPTGSIKFQ